MAEVHALSQQQRGQIEGILDRQEEALEDYWESRVPDMREIISRSYDQIRAILSPEQRDTFDARIRSYGIAVPRDPDG